ncbi:GNAT family N-acetyltransferase [Streptomyces sp900116325]|uniref:GNAT family N-acetyltransferase n=1 Tax=Streptomyces sp. 900116325 TaxID=3154295 RepID=UPI00331EF211
MTSTQIAFGLGEHRDAAQTLLRSEWPLVELPPSVKAPRFWTMTYQGLSGLVGLAIVVNEFKPSGLVGDEPRAYRPVLDYLVIDPRVRDRRLGRQLASRVLEEACEDADEVIVEVEHERPGAVRFWTKHMWCTALPDNEQTYQKVLRLRWAPAQR